MAWEINMADDIKTLNKIALLYAGLTEILAEITLNKPVMSWEKSSVEPCIMQDGLWLRYHCFGCSGWEDRERCNWVDRQGRKRHPNSYSSGSNDVDKNKGPRPSIMWWYFGHAVLKTLQLLRVKTQHRRGSARRFRPILIFPGTRMNHFLRHCEGADSVGLSYDVRKGRRQRSRMFYFMQIRAKFAGRLHTDLPKVWQKKR